jgi:large subunit ribosomal protein L29
MEKIKDLRTLDAKAITGKLEKLKKEIFDMKILSSTTGLEKPHKLKDLKRTVARLMTVASEKTRK